MDKNIEGNMLFDLPAQSLEYNCEYDIINYCFPVKVQMET